MKPPPLRSPLRAAICATLCLACGFQQGVPAAPRPTGLPQQRTAAPTWRQSPPETARGPAAAIREIRAFFDEYLRLHAARDMDAWARAFLPEAVCVRTADDGRVIVYRAAELAASIAEEAKKLESQHETLEDVRIEVEGDAGMYSTLWRLFHNGKEIRQGRAWFSLARREGKWKIAALVWYRRAGTGVR